jgi:uncharacterized coiled-coil protein SlyX
LNRADTDTRLYKLENRVVNLEQSVQNLSEAVIVAMEDSGLEVEELLRLINPNHLLDSREILIALKLLRSWFLKKNCGVEVLGLMNPAIPESRKLH